MTYSNRPTVSPWRHQSEFGVSNDTVVFDKINPFVHNMPGAWSAPYKYDNTTVPDKEVQDRDTSKPICEYASTAGDNTVSLCNPPPKNCPMKRPWVPERNIDPGMWTYQKMLTGNSEEQKEFRWILCILALTVAFLAWRRYTS